MPKQLVAVPVFNEAQYIDTLIIELRRHHRCTILFVDDGSTDESAAILARHVDDQVKVISHPRNLGYGQSLIDAFKYAQDNDYHSVVTMDSDWQHEPKCVPHFFAHQDDADIISGSRYLPESSNDAAAPADRKAINTQITEHINRLTGFGITDAFCGFKAYRVASLSKLKLDEPGYAFPLQLWIQAHCAGLTVEELPVPRIYIDASRTFGGHLDNPEVRLKYYLEVIERERKRCCLK